jgi:hypothetical protein
MSPPDRDERLVLLYVKMAWLGFLEIAHTALTPSLLIQLRGKACQHQSADKTAGGRRLPRMRERYIPLDGYGL